MSSCAGRGRLAETLHQIVSFGGRTIQAPRRATHVGTARGGAPFAAGCARVGRLAAATTTTQHTRSAKLKHRETCARIHDGGVRHIITPLALYLTVAFASSLLCLFSPRFVPPAAVAAPRPQASFPRRFHHGQSDLQRRHPTLRPEALQRRLGGRAGAPSLAHAGLTRSRRRSVSNRFRYYRCPPLPRRRCQYYFASATLSSSSRVLHPGAAPSLMSASGGPRLKFQPRWQRPRRRRQSLPPGCCCRPCCCPRRRRPCCCPCCCRLAAPTADFFAAALTALPWSSGSGCALPLLVASTSCGARLLQLLRLLLCHPLKPPAAVPAARPQLCRRHCRLFAGEAAAFFWVLATLSSHLLLPIPFHQAPRCADDATPSCSPASSPIVLHLLR